VKDKLSAEPPLTGSLVKAPEIVEFWRLNLRIQMDARMGILTANKAQGIRFRTSPNVD
jgi:hypothetical protein